MNTSFQFTFESTVIMYIYSINDQSDIFFKRNFNERK